jgi:hypothetical protein
MEPADFENVFKCRCEMRRYVTLVLAHIVVRDRVQVMKRAVLALYDALEPNPEALLGNDTAMAMDLTIGHLEVGHGAAIAGEQQRIRVLAADA